MSWKFPAHHELVFEAVRSRGPGGQNVNKTNSAAILRWNFLASEIPENIRQRLSQKLRLTSAGEVLIRSDVHRDLEQNKKACIAKLKKILADALFIPKTRKATAPTYSAVRKRLMAKKMKSVTKKLRRSPVDED
jgi:ribosome-associated protein